MTRSSLQAPDPVVYLVSDRRTTISLYAKGNTKLGEEVFTYDRLPGKVGGTCPGATAWCEVSCYAKRLVQNPPVWDLWRRNSESSYVPPIPEECRLLRIHVSGDFDRPAYIRMWIRRLTERPDVTAWAYTRSWRVPELCDALDELRELPNMQLFASLDEGTTERERRLLVAAGWRLADIAPDDSPDNYGVWAQPVYVCPEERGRKANCADCGYCFRGQRGGVAFIAH